MAEHRHRAEAPDPATTDTPTRKPTPPDLGAQRALSPEADERQTERQAPSNAWPGEGAEDDSIG
ncbi:MAG: hypothetical protein AB1942_26085 [Pseudomonadota bacterium]